MKAEDLLVKCFLMDISRCPDDAAKEVGSVFEVILLPAGESDIYGYAETLAREKGFKDLTVDDVEKIIHESRGVR